jgi:hypothetical protein
MTTEPGTRLYLVYVVGTLMGLIEICNCFEKGSTRRSHSGDHSGLRANRDADRAWLSSISAAARLPAFLSATLQRRDAR